MRRPVRSIVPTDRWTCLSFAAIVAALFLIAGIDRAGIWDPHELERAELARRIAVALFDAELAVPDALSSMPTLSDLGAGELGFTSMAAGFATWGLHPFAGRLPLALWCFVGVLAVFAFVSRTASPRAGMFAALALSTMPAYFVQARTMLGDGVSLAAFALAFFGLAGALMEVHRTGRLAFLVMGVVGAVAGFLSRGWLLGVAAPCAGVGLAWLALLGSADSAPWRSFWRVSIGVASLATTVGASWLGAAPLMRHGHELREVPRALGMSVLAGPAPESTFDLTLRQLGHGLFPWSAFLPFAFGLLLVRKRLGLRTVLLVGAAGAYAFHAGVAPFVGALAFVGMPVLAAVIGVVIDELDDGPAVPVVAGGTVLLLAVLLRDIDALPDKGLAAFAVQGAELPPGLSDSLRGYLLAAAGVFAGFMLLSWTSAAPTEPSSLRQAWKQRLADYETLVRDLSQIWAGNLAFAFLVLEAALLGMGATLLIGRRLGWPTVVGMSRKWAYVGLNLWWSVPIVLVTLPLAIDIMRRGYTWLLARLHAPRSIGMLIAALGSGGILCFGYYSAMAEQLSPKGALDAYASRHRVGEPLGLLGLSARMGRYYARGDVTTPLASPRAATQWLAGDGTRRWLAFRDSQLAELNALHRHAHGENLAVVESGSGPILLASSHSVSPNANPLEPFVWSKPPHDLQHPMKARFGDQLEVLGWDVVGEQDERVEQMAAGSPYRLRFYLHVLKRISRSYRAFIHIDAASRRHNGDHDVLGGMYPTTFWREGDYIVDEHEVTLEPHFSPGRYAVYFGFYIFNERLAVSEGQHHDDRLIAGSVMVY